jgi:hypothetical protein
VFWSKDYGLLLPCLENELKNYNKVFQFTITGHPKVFEPNVPPTKEAVETAHKLARLYIRLFADAEMLPVIASTDTLDVSFRHT